MFIITNQMIQKFNDGERDLFIFEWDGKFATIAPELMAFEGYQNPSKGWFDVKAREKFKKSIEFETLKGDILKALKQLFLESNDLSLVVTETVKTLYDQYKSVSTLDIVFESGIYGVMQNSGSNHAIEFKKFMRRDVAPAIRENGKFDMVEHNIKQIEDEEEKKLRLKLHKAIEYYNLDQDDIVSLHQMNKSQVTLDTYLQNKKIVLLEENLVEVKEEFQEFKEDVNVALSLTSIDRHEQQKILKAKNIRVVSMLGGKNDPRYKIFGTGYCDKCLSDMKKKFQIPSYKDLAKTELNEAIKFIENWQADKYIDREILSEMLVKRDNKELKKEKMDALASYLFNNYAPDENEKQIH